MLASDDEAFKKKSRPLIAVAYSLRGIVLKKVSYLPETCRVCFMPRLLVLTNFERLSFCAVISLPYGAFLLHCPG